MRVYCLYIFGEKLLTSVQNKLIHITPRLSLEYLNMVPTDQELLLSYGM